MSDAAKNIVEGLASVVAAGGIPVSDGSDRIVPKIHLDEPVRDMALKLGQMIRRCGVFRFPGARGLFTIADDGARIPMNAHRFCSWVEDHVNVVKSHRMKSGEYADMRCSLGRDLANVLLEADKMVYAIPQVQSSTQVRLPVHDAGGTVTLCQQGFNPGSGVYCTDSIEFDTAMTVAQAKEVWCDLCGGFQFADGGALWENRSFLVHFSAALGIFCRMLIPPMTIRPMVMWVANQQGAGKSLSMCMALAPCFGEPSPVKLPLVKGSVNAEKVESLLDAVAQTYQPYLALDDVPGTVVSNALNAFVTSPRHSGRIFGRNNELYDVPAVTQVFCTGNNVQLERDLLHRMLVCELWITRDADTFQHGVEMTPKWLARPENRSRMLASLWAFVRDWGAAGSPAGPWVKNRAPEWSRMISGILSTAGITVNPFESPDLPMAGDLRGEEIRQVLVAIADRAESDPFQEGAEETEITLLDFIAEARAQNVLIGLVGTTSEEKPLAKKELQTLGIILKQWRGRDDLISTSGRRFQFGRRRQRSGSIYPITWI